MSPCPGSAELLDHLGGQLAFECGEAIEHHLEICASCRSRVDALAKAVTSAGLHLLRTSAPVGARSQAWFERLAESPPSSRPCSAEEIGVRGDRQFARSPGILSELPGFTDLREVGRGGMGVVYRARELGLDRTVALKAISEGRSAGAAARERFRRESLALARLKHPNVVGIYGVGEYEGLPYLVLEWIDGGDLAQRLRDGIFSPREVAALGLPLAQALQAAHDQGIIHRDLKPSNILLADPRSSSSSPAWPHGGVRLEPKIGDFGLAKLVEFDGKATQAGAAIGTPHYMAPEQTGLIDNAQQGPATDIYGLGAILYELLVGHPPFEGATRHETIRHVVKSEVISPRRLRSAVPRDLETICLKCLEREPSQRYASAGALADDLARYLDGRPIRSRRVRAAERCVRWCRRNPVAAALLAALIVVFHAGFAAVTLEWHRAEAEAARANHTARAAAEARDAESRLRIHAQTEMAVRDFDRGLELAREGDADRGQLWMVESLRETPVESRELARVIRTNLAAWRGQSASLRAVIEHRGMIYGAVFRSDGEAVLTGSADGTAQLSNPSTGRAIGPAMRHGDQILCVALSPIGNLALTGGSDGKARLWNANSGDPVGPSALHGSLIWSVAFSPDSRYFMTYGDDRTARLWETQSGRPVGEHLARGCLSRPCFSPADRWVVCGEPGGIARLRDAASGAPVGTNLRHGSAVSVAVFSPHGRQIATGGANGVVRVWDAASGQPIGRPLRHGGRISSVVFSPDGKLVLTTSTDRTARLWDAIAGAQLGPELRHDDDIKDAVFSPDGRLILTGSLDHTARLWDTATGRPIGSPLRHQLAVRVVSFSPDGRLALSAGEDGAAKLWEIDAGAIASAGMPGRVQQTQIGGAGAARATGLQFGRAVVSADRSRIVLGDSLHGIARVVDTATGQPVGVPMKHRWPCVIAVAFGPDGRRIATASCERGFQLGGGTSATCQIWDAGTGRPTGPLLPHINWPAVITFRPDGKVLATGDYSGAVHLWDVESGASLGSPILAPSIVFSLAFSPDGRTLAVGTAERVHQVELWDVPTRKSRGEPIRFKHFVISMAFSPDGTRLAAGSTDSTVRLVDVDTGTAIGEPLRHADRVRGVVFSPDGRLLLTINTGPAGTAAARLWDTATGQPASAVLVHASDIPWDAHAFSPDGSFFATGCEDGSIHLWDTRTVREIGPPLLLRGPVRALAFGTRGRTLLAVDERGDARVWPLPEPSGEPVDWLVARLSASFGVGLDAARELSVLDAETSGQRLREQGALAPPQARVDCDTAWNESCARDAETIGNSFAARWHLTRLIAARPGDAVLRARHGLALLTDGDRDAARLELDRAIQLGPVLPVVDWLMQKAEDLRTAGRPADALLIVDRAVAARPDDWLGFAQRADALSVIGRADKREAAVAGAVERGADIPFLIRLAEERGLAERWSLAAELYGRAIALGTVPYEVWRQASVVYLEIDDGSGYQMLCETMRRCHPSAGLERWVAAELAAVCTLGPGGIGDDGKAWTWVSELLAGAPPERRGWRHEFLRIQGGLCYRCGRFREAIDRINEGIAAGDGDVSVEDIAFLAMAYHALGDTTKARAILSEPQPIASEISTMEYWNSQARLVLRREAQRMILDATFPSNPFAR
jgi:WD40 repeat protein/tetratricopeptide (TPR) repeat protein